MSADARLVGRVGRSLPAERRSEPGALSADARLVGQVASGLRGQPLVEVRRSPRRRRTVSAYRDGERVVVLIPDRFSRAEESEWVDRMLARLARRTGPRQSDAALLARAHRLIERYLPEYDVAPASVRWVGNQQARWGSCTPEDATIRISDRVRGMPDWVIDYVVLHELVHLIVPSHGSYFWALVGRYPKSERARGYLEGISAAGQLP